MSPHFRSSVQRWQCLSPECNKSQKKKAGQVWSMKKSSNGVKAQAGN